MTEMDESRVPSIGAVISVHNQLLQWLCGSVLPLWDERGVDRRSGGYFETISIVGPQRQLESTGAVRRGRVVARQIYVFDVGRELGWRSSLSDPVAHGREYLFSRLHVGDGVFHTAVDAATYQPCSAFDLYEAAFYLFALARLHVASTNGFPIAETALGVLRRLRADLGKRIGGFEESHPPSLPLKSNPHMHLLEAALAWVDATDGSSQRPWLDLARELVGLCLTRFRDGSSGAVREFFDDQWRPFPGDDGRIVEPGHQFEWAWLLMKWSASPHSSEAERAACTAAACKLIDIGERWGVDSARGIAINELWDDMTVKDASAKLWPQTERVKAWCAMLDAARTPVEAERAARKIDIAARGMAKYIRSDVPGLWHEACLVDGEFASGPTKASSLYHVAGAIDVLRKTISTRLTSVLYSPP
jgi:mannose/cellobiose epimerase-like protein (N-acyl-D-glucosamine 2-epimerase family)